MIDDILDLDILCSRLNAYSVRDLLKELSYNGVMNKAKTLDKKY